MARVTPTGARRVRRRPMSEINVVPYIDVMLVLLVIFMVTAPLLYHGVDLDLPEVESSPLDEDEQEPVIVSLDAEGRAYLNTGDDPDEALATDALLEGVRAAIEGQPQRQVLIRGDQAVPYGRVVDVMGALQQAGVPSVGLMSRPPQGGNSPEDDSG